MQDSGLACVYWLHLSSHRNPEKEGYIGVTLRDPDIRLLEHYKAAHLSRKKKSRFPLHEVILKYGLSGIQLTVLFTGTEKECYKKEQELRPLQLTGWNAARGGK